MPDHEFICFIYLEEMLFFRHIKKAFMNLVVIQHYNRQIYAK